MVVQGWFGTVGINSRNINANGLTRTKDLYANVRTPGILSRQVPRLLLSAQLSQFL